MTYTYTAYGLVFQLPYPCPILPIAPVDATPDVVAVDGTVPRQLAAPVIEDSWWQAEPQRFLWLGGMHTGRFLVEGGERITFERSSTAKDELLAFHFLAAVLAAVLRQRGLLVLHANAALTPTGAVAISGESGAGKSTTLAALLARGCAMLADDITALRLACDGHVEALPGVPQLHLTEDAAAGLGRDISSLPRYPWRRMKAAIPAHAEMAASPAPLRVLYQLQTHSGDRLCAYRLRGVEKFAALQDCVYGPLLPEEQPGQFPLLAAIAEQVAIVCIERPAEQWTVDKVAEMIMHTCVRGEISNAD